MKIIVTANTAWNLVNFRRGLIESFVANGDDVLAVAPDDKSVATLKKMGVRFENILIDNKGTSPINDLLLAHTFFRLFRREKPDIVLSYTIKNNIYGGIAARVLNVPFLPNVSGLGTAFLASTWLEQIALRLYRVAFRKARYVVFQNSEDSSLFISKKIIFKGQEVLVPGSGVNLKSFHPSQTVGNMGSQMIFLMIARMLEDKGVREFVEAARGLKQEYPTVRFQLLGDCNSPNRSAIQRDTIDSWVREGVVEYLGVVEDVRPNIDLADCVVLPSYREGAPRTLIEASAMARPVIATDVPGCRDVVETDVTGFLCEAKSAESLRNSMRKMILMTREQRVTLGKAGRKKIEREFDQSIVVKIYTKTIQKLLNKCS